MYNVNKIFFVNGTPGPLYRCHGSHTGLEIWLVAEIVVPLHRQSEQMAFPHAQRMDGRMVYRTNGRTVEWTDRRMARLMDGQMEIQLDDSHTQPTE